MTHTIEREIAGKKLTIETGELAQQANAAITIRYGDTMLLVTVVIATEPRPGVDFLPLTVDYEERLYAAGKIPGSFFRREGRPTTEAILSGRLTDRSLRPLLPKAFRRDIQVVSTVLSVDLENPPDILSMIGASAVLTMCEVPFEGPIGACRIGQVDGQFVVNPTFAQLQNSTLNMVIANTKENVVMVEAGAKEVSEETILAAIRKAQEANAPIISMIEELAQVAGKPKIAVPTTSEADEAKAAVQRLMAERVAQVIDAGLDKTEREAKLAELAKEATNTFADKYPEDQMEAAFDANLGEIVRKRILENGVRPDGRKLDEIRPITCKVGILPRTHGSGLFTRGQTQVLTIATLASMGMEQTLDTLSPEDTKRYMHHYNFPPYSVGETGRLGSPGRREVGHGALAERALLPVIPDEDKFPYAIRLVSEVLSSNGSTSMGSVCGSTLALMDAGVPIKAPVGGVAMGLVKGEGDQFAVLTDIQGIEDHLGDMDFKVAGTAEGVTALQMDIKVKGLTIEILQKALAQARDGRLFILDKMRQAIAEPRPQISMYAPKMYRIKIPVEKIGAVIGSGGRTIRSIIEESGATVDVEDDGTVLVGAPDEAAAQKAIQRIEGLTREIQVGDIFTGKVTRVANFGVFVELMPGREGLVRNPDLGQMEDGVKVGQELTVQVVEIDSMGRVNVSRRALTGEAPGPEPARSGPPGGPGSFRGGGRPRFGDRGPGGFRGGDRGGERRGPPPDRSGPPGGGEPFRRPGGPPGPGFSPRFGPNRERDPHSKPDFGSR